VHVRPMRWTTDQGRLRDGTPRRCSAGRSYLRFTGIADGCYFVLRPSFSSLTTSAITTTSTAPATSSSPPKGNGIPGPRRKIISAIRVRTKEATSGAAVDSLTDLRSDIVQNLRRLASNPRCIITKLPAAASAKSTSGFSTLLGTARQRDAFKYVVKNTAFYYGKAATFMPKRCSATTAAACTVTRVFGKATSPCCGDKYAGHFRDGLNYAGAS